MNKLTANKCREQIAEWERMMSASDIAVMVERHLQAYRIALPILEQQERGESWIEWRGKCGGNDQPVIGMVEVKFRNGNTQKSEACDWYLPHDGIASDIIAYRIIPERATNQNGEQ